MVFIKGKRVMENIRKGEKSWQDIKKRKDCGKKEEIGDFS
jgi:hypothetical protein